MEMNRLKPFVKFKYKSEELFYSTKNGNEQLYLVINER
jgi:hypothetical protein